MARSAFSELKIVDLLLRCLYSTVFDGLGFGCSCAFISVTPD